MQLGLITDSVGSWPLERALDLAVELRLDTVEIATGNWSESPHANLQDLLDNTSARKRLRDAVTSRGLTLSALNANGSQLHPVEGPQHDTVVRNSIEVAAALNVPTVVLMSGLPGARGEKTPNWITTSWPPETLDVLGYDGPVNIEHEDVLVGSEEGVRRSAALLHSVALRDAPDWAPARI